MFFILGDELFVNNVVRNLSALSRGDENIIFCGLQGLMNHESISIDYFENLNFIYPSSYWIDPLAPKTERFRKTFLDKYEGLPSEFAFRGYDITLYFGYMLHEFGPQLNSFLETPVYIPNQLFRFYFAPSKGSSDEIKFYENNNVVILKYDNYKFEKVN